MSPTISAALRRTLGAGLGLAALTAAAQPAAVAGQATVYYACYVPSSGSVYRIKEPGLPTQCSTSTKKGVTVQHVEFSWSDGQSHHGSLTGLAADDHLQYLLANGARTSTNGFAVNGTLGTGSIPASGNGTRFMWYPGKAAFRAGETQGSDFEDSAIGTHSVAFGLNARAQGDYSVAMGASAKATEQGAIMLGAGTASGLWSLAIGAGAHATANFAISMGYNSVASGANSVALGTYANTNNKTGAFVLADRSSLTPVQAADHNQFVVRAARFWFGNSNAVTATAGRYIETSTGAFLSTGGTWTNSSDVNRKTGFQDVDLEDVLNRVAAMPVSTWSYRDEDTSVRHIGPTAQDFRAAFGLGSTDKAIATVDADGVSLAAIQALAKRTAELKRENESLRSELRALTDRVENLMMRLDAGNHR